MSLSGTSKNAVPAEVAPPCVCLCSQVAISPEGKPAWHQVLANAWQRQLYKDVSRVTRCPWLQPVLISWWHFLRSCVPPLLL